MKRGAENNRPARVGEQIRSELMDLLLRGAVHDPRAAGVSVSAVRMTDDLQHARVFIRLLEVEPTAIERRAAVEAMNRASGYLRRELSHRLHLRYLPDLRFFWDDAVDQGERIELLLHEIRSKPSEGQ